MTVSSVETCLPLTTPDNGSISYDSAALASGEYGVGAVATYSCDNNFDLSGSTNSNCTVFNFWTNHGSEPTCQSKYSLWHSY